MHAALKKKSALVFDEQHRDAVQHQDLIEPDAFDSYFKFSFVRNPWDRLLSQYTFRKQLLDKDFCPVDKYSLPFGDWINYVCSSEFDESRTSHGLSVIDYHLGDQLNWLTDSEGNLLVEFIGRFENLQEDFNSVCDKIGTRHKKLRHKNKSKHKPYWEYYDDATKELVAEKCKKDIEYFGYEFG